MKNSLTLLIGLLMASYSFSQTLPDVTSEFETIIGETNRRCQELQQKWPVNEQTFKMDLDYLLGIKTDPVEKLFNIYYGNLTSWKNMKARFDYIQGYFKTGAKGDIKNTDFKKYTTKNGGKVIYKGKTYTTEQLGNINFGIACKAIGIPATVSTCAAGCYQILADQCIKLTTENAKKYLAAIRAAVKNKELRGACLDYRGDTQMIRMGYGWY
jgi:hypothetical protein